jgi:hypothetical protein
MEFRNAPPGTLRDSTFQTQYERGPVEAFHHTAGDNADHAAMPAFAREYQSCIQIGNRLLQAQLDDGLGDAGFRLLAILIQILQLRRQFLCARGIGGQEQAMVSSWRAIYGIVGRPSKWQS